MKHSDKETLYNADIFFDFPYLFFSNVAVLLIIVSNPMSTLLMLNVMMDYVRNCLKALVMLKCYYAKSINYLCLCLCV